MPAVFVHGVPDSSRVWQPTIDCLKRRDTLVLGLPGFGSPLPLGFTATKDRYAEWLLAQLRALRGPIDLVGHDWGSMLVVRAVSLAPQLVRSWVGGAAPIDPDYVWHETARIWQAPEAGEKLMAQITRQALQAGLVAQGQPPNVAADSAAAMDDTMKACILSLYRSAVHVGREWFADLALVTAPGLVIWGKDDPYAAPTFGERLAKSTGAGFAAIEDCGHWWQAQRPRETAKLLEAFWTARAS
jgi:pimeloyl-ACP methyl ester carboxylesterase